MQRAQSGSPNGHRIWVATLAVAFLTVLLLPLAQAAAGSASTLDRVKQSGKLTLGYRADARPFSFKDESGNAAGYAVALCQRIAEQVKTELGRPTLAVEWVPVTVEDRFRAVRRARSIYCAEPIRKRWRGARKSRFRSRSFQAESGQYCARTRPPACGRF